jgi:hypothetical protein
MALAFACWSTSGCLAADEPTFQEPLKTPPFLLAQTAVPDVTKPVVAFSGPNVDQVDLSVEVRSEDVGDRLVAKLVYGYPPGIDLGPSARFPAGKLADTERVLSLKLGKNQLPLDESKSPPEAWTGCLQVSMLVTHESNLQINEKLQVIFRDPEDIGVITWWFNLPDPRGATATLDRCSNRLGTAQ